VPALHHIFDQEAWINKMKASILTLGTIGVSGIFLVSMLAGAGCVRAETYRQGDSTATIEQSGGGSGPSESEVTRYPDGQKIITRDGNNTDITIQRSGGPLPSDTDINTHDFDYWENYRDRFDPGPPRERFSHIDPDDGRGGNCYECDSSSTRDEFKRRALERMGSDVLP
jgi:hypothetical protein